MNYQINDNELVYMVNEDPDLYFDVLFKKYKPIIYKFSFDFYYSYSGYGADVDDFFQEGLIGFYNAINTYRANDSLFYTYVCICIKRSLISYCRKINSPKNKFLNESYSDCFLENIPLINDNLFLSPLYEYEFVNLKNLFYNDESFVFELKYNGFSYIEISRLLDLSMGKVSACICKIKLNLKKMNYLFN